MTNTTQMKNLLKKLGTTLFILLIYMLGSSIPIPLAQTSQEFRQVLMDSPIGIMSFMSGGNLQHLSLFMIGLTPLMIAMMFVQLLTMMRLFYFDTLSTQQMMKIQQWCSLLFAVIQSLAITLGMHITTNSFKSIMVILMLTAGSMFVIWLGNMNMSFGIGGTITLIMFNIISGSTPNLIRAIKSLGQQPGGILWIGGTILTSFLILIFWIAFNRAYYPIKMINTMMSSKDKPLILPIGLNNGAMMTYMIGMSILMLPTLLVNRFGTRSFLVNPYFNVIVSGLLAFILFYFFTFVQFDPKQQAKTMLRSNNYILGIRPGEPTRKYLRQKLIMVSFPGALLNAIQLSFGLLGNQVLGGFAGLAIVPMNIIMIVMFMQGIKDQLLMLIFPLKYEQLLKEESL